MTKISKNKTISICKPAITKLIKCRIILPVQNLKNQFISPK